MTLLSARVSVGRRVNVDLVGAQKPFLEYVFYIPPIAARQEFAAFVAQVGKLKFETQQEIDKLQLLNVSLAHEYFVVK